MTAFRGESRCGRTGFVGEPVEVRFILEDQEVVVLLQQATLILREESGEFWVDGLEPLFVLALNLCSGPIKIPMLVLDVLGLFGV